MKRIDISEKTGFHTNDKFVRVYDSQNRLFYFFDMQPGRYDLHFNLPPGTYYTRNKIRQSRTRKYKLPTLPKFERNYTPPRKLDIAFGHNPNKATIDVTTGKVLFDYSLRKLSKPQLVYIVLHERGHYHYSTEHFCDLYAMREMLKKGYNPSQIARSIDGALSNAPGGFERKDFIVGHCEKSF